MQDHIPDALIAAFERQYGLSFNEPGMDRERWAWRYGWAAAIEQKQCLVQISEPTTQAAVDAPVAAGEREAFEAWARSYGSWEVKRDDDQALGTTSYTDLTLTVAWHAIQGRAALAATPAAAAPMVDMTPPATSRDRWMYEQGRLAERDARTHGNVAAAAPVVLPEPFALYDGEKWYANEEAAICSCADMAKLQKVFIESQLLTLLAGVSAPAAQVVPDGWTLVPVDLTPEMKREFMDLLMDGIDIYVNRRDQIEIQTDAPRRIWKAVLALSPAAPQAQADARDAAPAASEQDAPQQDLYYLQDARWSAMVGNCPSWWRPDGNGYTTNLDEAARFTFAEAMAQHRCRDTDLPWLCSEVDKLRRPTVDCQYMPRSWGEQRVQIHAQAAAKEGVQQG